MGRDRAPLYLAPPVTLALSQSDREHLCLRNVACRLKGDSDRCIRFLAPMATNLLMQAATGTGAKAIRYSAAFERSPPRRFVRL